MTNQYTGIGDNETEESGDKFSSALYLKKYIKKEVEELLNEIQEYNFKKADNKNDRKLLERNENPAKVVAIEFAYKNHNLIHLLRDRGTAIVNCDWKKLKDYDNKITALFNDPKKTKLLR